MICRLSNNIPLPVPVQNLPFRIIVEKCKWCKRVYMGWLGILISGLLMSWNIHSIYASERTDVWSSRIKLARSCFRFFKILFSLQFSLKSNESGWPLAVGQNLILFWFEAECCIIIWYLVFGMQVIWLKAVETSPSTHWLMIQFLKKSINCILTILTKMNHVFMVSASVCIADNDTYQHSTLSENAKSLPSNWMWYIWSILLFYSITFYSHHIKCLTVVLSGNQLTFKHLTWYCNQKYLSTEIAKNPIAHRKAETKCEIRWIWIYLFIWFE